MEISAAELAYRDAYKLLIGSIVPRPIAWVSSVSPEGNYNLAPYSFFTAVCPNPPTVVFCPNIRSLNGEEKDTLKNIQATQEFVVNIVTESNAEAMNITSSESPADVDEFALAGLTATPALHVKAPRVAESPIHFECKLVDIIKIGEGLGSGSMVVGEVIHFHIDDAVYVESYKVDAEALQAVGRMSGFGYTRTRDRFDLVRPPAPIPPSDEQR